MQYLQYIFCSLFFYMLIVLSSKPWSNQNSFRTDCICWSFLMFSPIFTVLQHILFFSLFNCILYNFANNKYLLIFVHYFTIFETFKIHVYLFRKKIKIRSSVSFEHLVDWCKSLMYVNDTNDTHTPATDWTRRIVCANNVCGPRWACIWCGYIIFHGHVYMQKYINMADGRWAIMGLKVLRPLYRFGVHANDVWVRLPVCVLVCACECVVELYRVWMATIFHKLVCAFDCRCLQLNTHKHTQTHSMGTHSAPLKTFATRTVCVSSRRASQWRVGAD